MWSYQNRSAILQPYYLSFCILYVYCKNKKKKQTHTSNMANRISRNVFMMHTCISTQLQLHQIQCTLVKYRNRSCNQHNPAVKYGFLFVPISFKNEWYNGFAVFAVCVRKRHGIFCGWSLWWACFRDFWHHCECVWLFTERDGVWGAVKLKSSLMWLRSFSKALPTPETWFYCRHLDYCN